MPQMAFSDSDRWTVLDTGVRPAQENMLIDAELLETLDTHSLPILHFYGWQGDSATYGYFVNPETFLHLDRIKSSGLALAKRPTGGGIVFHIWDLAFSVLIPASHPYFSANTLDNYAFVNRLVLAAVGQFLGKEPELIQQDGPALSESCTRFCMAQPTKYDVIFNGKKIAGAAQRKTKKGFLHQGTIALKLPSTSYLKSILLSETEVLEAMLAHTFPLLSSEESLDGGRAELKRILEHTFTRELHHVTEC